LLVRAKIQNFWFHDLRHTFASWYMMNGGDLYELAKILGHSNIKMTERYAKLGRKHMTKTSNTAKLIWTLMKSSRKKSRGTKRTSPERMFPYCSRDKNSNPLLPLSH
jgi:Phage integrase family